MTLHPIIQSVLDAARQAPEPDPSLSIERLRDIAHAGLEKSFLALTESGPRMSAVNDHEVVVDSGVITVRSYTPEGDGPFPCHVYLHGGAFWLGTLDHFDPVCRDLAAGATCVVVSVGYRLAPEHHYPGPLEDCFTALRWTVEHADELRIDPELVSVGGGSAGGNLAAAVALMARDRGGPPLVFQLLDIPSTDLTMSQPSIEENGEGYGLTKAGIAQAVRLYLGDTSRAAEPYASPLLAPNLSGLPPALIMTCEFDPLRDEGEAYGQRLKEAGVPTTVRRWPGMIHGSNGFTAVLPEAREYRKVQTRSLRDAFASARAARAQAASLPGATKRHS